MANPMMYGWGIDISNAPSFKKAMSIQNFKAGQRTFARYSELAAHTIAFEGLTDTMDERCLREGFLWYPLVAIFKVGDKWINLPAVPGGRGFNAQGNFGDVYAYGKNGTVYHIMCHMRGEDESAFLSRTPGVAAGVDYEGYCLRAADNCFPLIDTVIFYSSQVADLMSAIANCTPLMHHPIQLQASQKQRATALKWYKELDENAPFIFTPPVSDSSGRLMSAEPVNLLQGGDIVKPTMELIDWLDQRCLMEIGIENAGTQVDKKGENLTTSEVTATDTVTAMVTQNRIDLINQQIKDLHINEIPGLEDFCCVKGHKYNVDISGMDRDEWDTVANDDTGDSESDE